MTASQPTPTSPSPAASLLADVHVLDLTAGSAQLAGRLVAELGADVLLLVAGEQAADAGELVAARSGEPVDIGVLRALALNSGKLRAYLDPAAPGAGKRLAGLVPGFDAVIVDDASPWLDLLDPARVAQAGTPVIVAHGFADTGPYAAYRSPDIVTMALGGLLFISGSADRAPCAPPEPIGEYFAAIWASLALASAVWAARTTGTAAVYRISTQEAIATHEHLIRAAAMDGEPIVRNGSQHKSVAPANVFPTKDGWVYIYVSRNHWEPFLRSWDPHPPVYDDARWLPNSVRRADAVALNAAVAGWTQTFTSRDLVTRLQGDGVPCLTVNRPSDFLADDQVVARKLFETVDDPTLGSYAQIRFPAVIDGARPAATLPLRTVELAERELGQVRS
jgi:crotonobetainyl-CoA:carnitine CoA-transferase CaiB-like acyl-CoA transferase